MLDIGPLFSVCKLAVHTKWRNKTSKRDESISWALAGVSIKCCKQTNCNFHLKRCCSSVSKQLLPLNCVRSLLNYKERVYKSQNLQDCTGATEMNDTNRLLLSHAARLFLNSRCAFSFQRQPYLYIFSNLVLFGVTVRQCHVVFGISIALCVFKTKKQQKKKQ